MNTSDVAAPQFDSLAVGTPSAVASSSRRDAGSCAGRVTQPCTHCGQPIECSADAPRSQVFCCIGCRGAYQLIQAWGLGDYYHLREQLKPGALAAPARPSSRYEQFDRAEFLGDSAPVDQPDGTRAVELALHGLHCGACAWLIESAAAMAPGWLSARVSLSDHTIRIVFDPGQTKLSHIAEFLDRLGYQLTPVELRRDQHARRESRHLLMQIAVAAFLAANAMWIAVALYAGEFSGVAEEHRYFLGLAGTGLGVLAVVGPGRAFLRGALASLRTRIPHMDLPIALGLTVGTVVGVVNSIAGHGDIYFDSIAALVFFLLIGRWLQFSQQQRAARQVDLLLRIAPRHATRLSDDGKQELVLVETLLPGQTIKVAAGESIAADGEVLKGQSAVDRSLLTGESVPNAVCPGDRVVAGTINISAPIEVRVVATGRDSRIGRVMRTLRTAAAEKTPIVQLADRIGGVFVVAVMMLAVLTFVCWYSAGPRLAAAHATALLIVACPCGLALATPLAVAVGLGRAAKRHILIRDGKVFQLLARPGAMWLDKTGTLTAGRQRVTSLFGDVDGLRLAAAIERHCAHPVAAAIVREAEIRGLPDDASATLERAGQGGVAGTVDGRRVYVGNAAFMRAHQINLDNAFQDLVDRCVSQSESPVLIAVDGVPRTLLGLSDPLRDGVQDTVDQLRRGGWSVGILSGDHPEIVANVARRLKLPLASCRAGLSPEEKLEVVRSSRKMGRTVVMIGDGANDAAALAAADVGVAVRGGAEVSLQAAPVFISSGSLESIGQLLRGSVRVTRLIYVTFAVSLGYNLIAVTLSMAGWVSPLAAALLMPLSSISVLALTLATKSFEETTS